MQTSFTSLNNSPLLVLDLVLDVIDGVRRLNLEGDRLASERLHKDLHVSTKESAIRKVCSIVWISDNAH